jgi:DNA-binding CsgD family transcriptional regulator
MPSLVRWGLSSDADLVFRTIATFGPRPARRLAVELGLPPRRVEAALGELSAASAAVSIADGRRAARESAVWLTRPPADVVAHLRARRFRQADHQAQVRSHEGVVVSLASRGGVPAPPVPLGGDLGEGVRYLSSRAATRRRLGELMAVASREQLAINTEQAFDAESARAAAPLDRQLVERGVRLRVIGLPPADGDLHVGASLLDHPRCGYREAAQVPMKLFVVDGRVALFPADPRDLERGYLEISQPGVVRALLMLFEHHWATAVDPREYGMSQIVLSERERELIALLAQGHTDVSAAAHMRISARSVTNILRSLMDRLGVDNRFQLGLALGAARATRLPNPGEQPTSQSPAKES